MTGVQTCALPISSLPSWSPNGKWLLFESERTGKKNIYKIEAPDGVKEGEQISFFAELEVDIQKERMKIFEESWNSINKYFYDPKFHGIDWAKIKDKYQKVAENAQTDLELNGVIQRMLGELKASHLGISGPDKKNRVSTGYLGCSFSEVPDFNVLKVEEVLKGGPADKAWIRKGDYVFQIHETITKKDVNIDNLLVNTVGKIVKIYVSPSLNPGEGRYVDLIPVDSSAIEELEYRQWLIKCVQTVKELCQGRVIYIHLKDMDAQNLRNFRELVLKAIPRIEGMILDVRNNGGGNIHQELIDILTRKPYIAYKGREEKVQYQPAIFWNRPVVVLINEKSFSDAEVFPYTFKILKRGYLVGMPTSGGVIGTKDITLSNQATFRIPQVGYYTLEGQNMEGAGVVPDFVVPETPKDRAEGKDPQLIKAIEIIMQQIAPKKVETKPMQSQEEKAEEK